jgi:hypothetical protein
MRYVSIGSASALGRWKLWAVEYFMAADAPPDDMRLAGLYFSAIVKRCTSVGHPGHLKDSWMTLHAFDTQTWAKWRMNAKVFHHFHNRRQE